MQRWLEWQTVGTFCGIAFLIGTAMEIPTVLGDVPEIYTVQTMTNEKILPDTAPVPGEKDGTISIVACPGEYESASFVVRAGKEPITGLTVTAGDLKGNKGTIPASNLNLKVLKCWYVGGSKDTGYRHQRLLTSELLVNDDGLVKVDTEKKNNYLKLTFDKGTPKAREAYVLISEEKDWKDLPEELPLAVSEFPVYDRETLQPVNIDAQKNKQFWITLKTPEKAQSGVYTGKIELATGKGVIGEVKIRVKVLPFTLDKPYYVSSIYYKGDLDPANKGTICTGGKSKNEKQYRAEMEDMFAHGVTNPTLYVCWRPFDPTMLAKMLEIRNSVGMSHQPVYNFGERVYEVPATPEAWAKLKADAKAFVDFCKAHGVTDVYFYGIDEARGDELKKQRPLWKAYHDVGGKIFVAGCTENIKYMGDLQDLQIACGAPIKEEAEKWHSKGKQVFNYANPQTGVEEPLRYRRNYGLLLWQNDYDGAMDHAYMTSYRNIWNDFDFWCREENMAYPTADGVVDTTEWEGYREGVDDVRYLTTLVNAVNAAKASADPKMKEKVSAAEKYLNELKTMNLKDRNMDTIRMEIIFQILGLKESK
jgi:hypothetical protein